MRNSWSFKNGLFQSMAAKKMFLIQLHHLVRERNSSKLSFIGFEIPRTVWSNQLNIIPASKRIMATLMKFLGTFISIDECGKMMAPLFTEKQEESRKKSGKFITWKKNEYAEVSEEKMVFSKEMLDKLWFTSLELCKDKTTTQIAEAIYKSHTFAPNQA